MKKFLALFLLFGLFVSFSRFCSAQSQKPLTKTQKKDVAKLVEEIRAKLPAGWLAKYPAKNRFSVVFEQEEIRSIVSVPLDYEHIDVYRVEKVRMQMATRPNGPPYVEIFEAQFRLDLNIEPFLSEKRYAEIVANNENVEKQTRKMYAGMRDIKEGHPKSASYPDNFRPKNSEEKARVEKYKKLWNRKVTLPRYHYRNIALSCLWFYDGPACYDVHDRAIRRECAIVMQDIESLLTPYSGERFKIDEETLSREYAEPEPPLVEKEGEVPGS